ncbi:MAG: DUF3035 domain-containing protein [Alphaproteobacteria bacterium]|nr:DUF3035 domain-containing protein [Alphaproteobacteria bacterium]
MRKVISFSLVAVLVLMLSACGLTKKDLGLARQGPDETLVKTNEPLILPPEYNVRPQKGESDSMIQSDDEDGE